MQALLGRGEARKLGEWERRLDYSRPCSVHKKNFIITVIQNSLVRSHCSFTWLLGTAHFARTLRCANSFACSLPSLWDSGISLSPLRFVLTHWAPMIFMYKFGHAPLSPSSSQSFLNENPLWDYTHFFIKNIKYKGLFIQFYCEWANKRGNKSADGCIKNDFS